MEILVLSLAIVLASLIVSRGGRRGVQAVERLERLVGGSFSRGRAGENFLAASLEVFPPEMVIRGFRIGAKTCEFALRMPDGRALPVDSKWVATDLVRELQQAKDFEATRRRVDGAVSDRVKEVAKYLDPSLTVGYAVMVVPDAVNACCRQAHASAHRSRVRIVSYSLAVPLLLHLWQMEAERGVESDHNGAILGFLEAIGSEVEGRLFRGLHMATNAAGEIRGLTGGIRAALRADSADVAGTGAPQPAARASLDGSG